MAHGKNTFGVAGKHSPWLNWQEMIDCNPDVIIVMPCGFDIPRTTSEMQVLQSKQGWGQLKAVRDKNVFVVDGNQYFNRPGPRIVESLEILIEILYPTLYSKAPGFTYVETGWQRVTDILA
jgi:iron complex transport system substrate-binding protein